MHHHRRTRRALLNITITEEFSPFTLNSCLFILIILFPAAFPHALNNSRVSVVHGAALHKGLTCEATCARLPKMKKTKNYKGKLSRWTSEMKLDTIARATLATFMRHTLIITWQTNKQTDNDDHRFFFPFFLFFTIALQFLGVNELTSRMLRYFASLIFIIPDRSTGESIFVPPAGDRGPDEGRKYDD